ncbi:hypothetical protein CPB83DRAFT_776377 [Crepidotus variabilis]|uniref:WD40 repeat-like protein n=1 Tax=Crepidotus variabilis TaxID=179855 RepID=A0A9P6E5M7_9AGAR|nr:hypothetical protein CPB83DRAFT_776377 [Crepidotus variabilis]
MAQARKRISYIIPSAADDVPKLQLPPHGSTKLGVTGPLLTLANASPRNNQVEAAASTKQPRHRLGVASLALDSSTQLIGRNAPEGILYSGGRDGLVMSWDLGITMNRVKPRQAGSNKKGRWENLTGWGDDVIDEETDDDERPISDGDVLGEVTTNVKKRRRAATLLGDIPFERQWETDISQFQPGTPSLFRLGAQVHTDWVNDILLCNYNQTVASASSDGTIKIWSPHATIPVDPTTIGTHSDYVRCLASCREQNWIASGSFDRTIKLWDLNTTTKKPLVTLNPPDATAPKSSVYALAADPFGQVIASGSPERVIRLWDPRTGRRTGKLVGHTDNIRAILISEDSKYLLTGSADASIKLWSLASQRCLHTFTHHTESVWSLSSSHPSLEVFYSGDRSGLVCRVDVEDCPDLSEGECLVLCNEAADAQKASAEGINKIAVMDDNLLWTASGTSTIRRWNIPQRRATRPSHYVLDADGDQVPRSMGRQNPFNEVPSESSTRPPTSHGHSKRLSMAPSVQSITSEQWREREPDARRNGLPYDCHIRLISPNDPFTPFVSLSRDAEVATLYSAASVMSVPRQLGRAPSQTGVSSPIQSSRTEETIMMANTARAEYEERELAVDALPVCSEPDFIIEGDPGLVRSIILNDRVHTLTVDTSGEVAVWDIVRGICLGRYLSEDVAAASRTGSIRYGNGEKEKSPREALEAVRERIEGEAVVSAWCMADTKAGVLTIHLMEKCFDAEVYADDVGFANDRHFNEESKLNLGKWALRNLFIGFIREQARRNPPPAKDGHIGPSLSRTSSREDALNLQSGKSGRSVSRSPEYQRRPVRHPPPNSTVISSPNLIPAVAPIVSSSVRSSPLLTPMISLHTQKGILAHTLPPIPQSPMSDVTPTPGHTRARSGTVDGSVTLSGMMTPTTGREDYFTQRARPPGPASSPAPDDFSGWKGPDGKGEPPTPSTPSGLMGRLRNFGRTKRPVSDTPLALTTPTTETPTIPEVFVIEVAKTPLQELLSGNLSPPSSMEGPPPLFPQNTTILISEEGSPSYTTIYRGLVSHTHHDTDALETAMPMWLVEYLLLNQIPPPAAPIKVSFVLVPWNKDPDAEPLPELLNTTQSKLTASRNLRIRKILNHVQDKLDRMSSGSRAPSVRSSVDGNSPHTPHSPNSPPRPRSEDAYEILCNDTLLPYGMSLAAVRQYVWKSSAELVMCYRRRKTLKTLT